MSNATTASNAGTKSNEGSKSMSNASRGMNDNRSGGQNQSSSDFETLLDDVTSAVVTYSKRQPKAIACGIFALGFMIGWKIKPW